MARVLAASDGATMRAETNKSATIQAQGEPSGRRAPCTDLMTRVRCKRPEAWRFGKHLSNVA